MSTTDTQATTGFHHVLAASGRSPEIPESDDVYRTGAPDHSLNMYGTTFRMWDPTIKAWRITWKNPVTGQRDEQIGRGIGNDIVQVGAHADGTATRWRFTEITSDSFRWIGEALNPDGTTWKLEGEFVARRLR